jgi:hypothetical protein
MGLKRKTKIGKGYKNLNLKEIDPRLTHALMNASCIQITEKQLFIILRSVYKI